MVCLKAIFPVGQEYAKTINKKGVNMKLITCMLLGLTFLAQSNQFIPSKELMPAHSIILPKGGPVIATVGSDGFCDYNNIQDAIDNADEVRIATNGSPYFENLLFGTGDATILKGSYSDCTMAGLNITDQSTTILDGSGMGSAIEIDGLIDVSISYLTLGHAQYGIHVSGDDMTNVRLNHIFSFNNDLFGLYIAGSDNAVYVNNTIISNNHDSGIYCSGATNNFSVFGNSEIKNNISEQNAGGVTVKNDCKAFILSPVIIEDNKTNNGGGGIEASQGGDISLLGVASTCGGTTCGTYNAPVIVKNNNGDADEQFPGSGGGAYVLGAGSELTLVNVVFEGNSAIHGGAISNNNGVVINYAYDDGESTCWNPGSCNIFKGNQAVFGSVFEFKGTSEALISGSLISSNIGGAVAYIWEETDVTFSNSIIVGNNEVGNKHIFQLLGFQGTPTLNVEYVTIADNQLEDTVIYNSESNFRIHSSIIAEETNVYGENEDISASFECVLVNESASFNAGGTVTVGEPEFMDAANGDYHNKPTSLAVDYCYEITSALFNDIDFDEYHGFDDPNKTNLHGTYDIGADEYIVDNDIIFKNSFEKD